MQKWVSLSGCEIIAENLGREEKNPAQTEPGPRELLCVSCTTFLKKLLTDPLTARIIHL
jgi:hypothetical protein